MRLDVEAATTAIATDGRHGVMTPLVTVGRVRRVLDEGRRRRERFQTPGSAASAAMWKAECETE